MMKRECACAAEDARAGAERAGRTLAFADADAAAGGAFGGGVARDEDAAPSFGMRACGVLCCILIAVCLVGCGFLACVLPPVTHTLSSAYAKDYESPFTKDELVQVADATRSYAFGAHDRAALLRAIYMANVERQADTALVRAGAPRLSAGSVEEAAALDDATIASELSGAQSRYAYDDATIGHLDDCARIAYAAYPTLAAIAAAACVLTVATYRTTARTSGAAEAKRLVGHALRNAGIGVCALFAIAGAAAAYNFNAFFGVFHTLFFTQGTWVFDDDSLLICALPTDFWIGMGAAWLATTLTASILCVLVGWRMAKASRAA
jgi:hypothetical protein